MIAYLQILAQRLGIEIEALLMIGLGLGVMLLIWGIYVTLRKPDPALVRLAAISGSRRQDRQDRILLVAADKGPGALMKAFVPGEKSKFTALQRKLAQAGATSPNAVQIYTFTRIGLALGLPALFLTLVWLSRLPDPPLPAGLAQRLSGMRSLTIYQFLSGLLAIGYFVPSKWLSDKVAARQRRIEESFPNALDLMQISIEAGLGFDAAMTRVGNELKRPSPDIAHEFLTVQHQVQAGRARDAAMRDMADRVGLETVRSFANVAQQSMQFGTSMSQALTTYAEELRQTRELRAQEMANKLPVKMSGVMASLMLPALVLMTIGPVVIRYMRQF
ncbi:MAG: type II secretion system F family protein [Paracoccaceae bacterium]